MTNHDHRSKSAFTLPVVLVAMAGLLILLGGLLVVVGLEQRSSRAHANAFRADLAARSALSEARAILEARTANDAYVILQAPVEVSHDDDGDGAVSAEEGVARPYLFLAQADSAAGDSGFSYAPLFSTGQNPDNTEFLELPEEAGLPDGDEERVAIRAVPSAEAPVLGWRYIEDADGKPVARYAFWMEDLEGYLDASVAGNDDGDEGHARLTERWPDEWPRDIGAPLPYARDDFYLAPFHAPGINPSLDDGDREPLDQIALYTLEEGGPQEDEADFDERIRGMEEFLLTDDSLLAALEVPAPLERDEDGRLTDELGRVLEENLVARNEPYFEQAVIPPVPGIKDTMVGEPKINLNRLLNGTPGAAVEAIAGQIQDAFPDFVERRGGFPEDYLRTLAANIVDYGDRNGQSTLEEGSYRGIDTYPFTSEFLLRYKWEWERDPHAGQGVITEGGRKYVLLTVAAYAELWNMCNHPVSGVVEYEYETQFNMSLGAVPQVNLMNEAILNRPIEAINPRAAESGARHELVKDEDSERWYFPPKTVELEPNEFRLIKLGDVRYKLDAGLSFMWVASPTQLEGDHGISGYHMKWNGQVVDRADGDLERPDASLNYPINTRGAPRQKVRGTIPGHGYGQYGVFHNGMGDPRIAYYAQEMQSLSAYPRNYSPWRRNVRLAIFRGDPNAIYGRVIPSEWPDGGHDPSFGRDSYYTEDQRIDPDDPRFEQGRPLPEPLKVPMRLSNLGLFFSETELGHIWDPVMWGSRRDPVTGGGLPDLAVAAWAKEIKQEHFPSPAMGGGNTLRIGRPEHPRFDQPGRRASGLLDLFHCGVPTSEDREEREGPLVYRRGHVNLNTAPRDVLRALAAGWLTQDPVLARELSSQPTAALKAPATEPLQIGPPTGEKAADVIADEIIRNRPYVSPSQLGVIEDSRRRVVFGNEEFYPAGPRLQWSDAAAEETFARVYNSSTVRSRNFRVHVIGQAIREIKPGEYNVLSTRRKQFRVFANPGERDDDGAIEPANLKIEVTYERDS